MTERIADRYTERMAQLVTRIDEELLSGVDALIADGTVASRSDAVRVALEQFVDGHRRRRIGEAIVEGYRRIPETEEELRGLDAATRALVAEEPW
jgi:metal-responsive CopG/Arc/MetJ family transcriptional regulator